METLIGDSSVTVVSVILTIIAVLWGWALVNIWKDEPVDSAIFGTILSAIIVAMVVFFVTAIPTCYTSQVETTAQVMKTPQKAVAVIGSDVYSATSVAEYNRYSNGVNQVILTKNYNYWKGLNSTEVSPK
jgi:uncharacterized membrane protein